MTRVGVIDLRLGAPLPALLGANRLGANLNDHAGDLWMKAHYGDIGIINIIRQRLKDVELQRWRWGVGGGGEGAHKRGWGCSSYI